MKMKKKEIWLNLGCGVGLAKPPFINVDNFFDLKDLEERKGIFVNAKIPKGAMFVKGDICALPFEDNYADYIEANDVIEHIESKLVDKALSEIYRVLKPGGKLGLSTTNFDALARLWTINVEGNKLSTQQDIDRCTTLTQVIYGHQASAGEFHKVPFNPYILGYRLQTAGFDMKKLSITIYPTNSPEMMPQKAYKGLVNYKEDTVILTEMMWVSATK
jgi:SAM-dependent methyltransferase